jgi:hypothetical protein
MSIIRSTMQQVKPHDSGGEDDMEVWLCGPNGAKKLEMVAKKVQGGGGGEAQAGDKGPARHSDDSMARSIRRWW